MRNLAPLISPISTLLSAAHSALIRSVSTSSGFMSKEAITTRDGLIISGMLRWLILICCTPLLPAQTADIREMLANSAAAWNRGDLPAFASDYEDSPQTTFIGSEVVRGGTKAILERYRKRYPNREAMGTLSFSEIEIRTLAPEIVLATGNYALTRTAAGGGDASGRFTRG